MQNTNNQQNPKRLLAIQGGANNTKRFKPDGKGSIDSKPKKSRDSRKTYDKKRIKKGLELQDVLLKGDPQGPLAVSDQKQDVWANIAKSLFSGFSISSNIVPAKCSTVSKKKEGPPPSKLEDAKVAQMVPITVDYNHANATQMVPISVDYNHANATQMVPFSVDYNHVKATQMEPFSVDHNHAKLTQMEPFSVDHNHDKVTQMDPFSVDYDHDKVTQMETFSSDYNHTTSSHIDERLGHNFPNFMEENSVISSMRNARIDSSIEIHDSDRRSFNTHVSQGDYFYDKQIPRNHTVTEFREQRMGFVVQSHSEKHYHVLNQNLEVGYVPENSNVWNRPASPESLQLSNAYAKDIDVNDSSYLMKNTGCSLKSFEGFHNKESLSTVNSRKKNRKINLKNRKINVSLCKKPKRSAASAGMRALTKRELSRMDRKSILQHLCKEMKMYEKADNSITDFYNIIDHVVSNRITVGYSCEKLSHDSCSGSLKIGDYFLVRLNSSHRKDFKHKVYEAAISILNTMTFAEVLKLKDPGPGKQAVIDEQRIPVPVNDPELLETIVRLKEAIHTTDLEETASPKENWQLIVEESRCAICPELTITILEVDSMPSYTASLKLNNYIITQCSDRSKAISEDNCYNSALHILRTKRNSELLVDDTGTRSLNKIKNISTSDVDKNPAETNVVSQPESLDNLKRKLNKVIRIVKTIFKPQNISAKLDSILETNFLFPKYSYKYHQGVHSSVVDCWLYANDLLLAVGKDNGQDEAKTSAYQAAWEVISGARTSEDLLVHSQSLNGSVKESVLKMPSRNLKYNNKPELRKYFETAQVNLCKTLDKIVIVELTEYTKRPFRNAMSILRQSATMSKMLIEWEVNDVDKDKNTERCVIQIQKEVVADITGDKESSPLQMGALTTLLKLTKDRPIFRINSAEPKIWIPTSNIEATEIDLQRKSNKMRSHIEQLNQTMDDIRMAEALRICIEKHLPVTSLEEGYVDVNFAHVIAHIAEFLQDRGMCWKYSRIRLNNGFQAVLAFTWICDPERIMKLLRSSRGSVGRYQLISNAEAQRAYEKALQMLSGMKSSGMQNHLLEGKCAL